jgi:hypothetical protein
MHSRRKSVSFETFIFQVWSKPPLNLCPTSGHPRTGRSAMQGMAAHIGSMESGITANFCFVNSVLSKLEDLLAHSVTPAAHVTKMKFDAEEVKVKQHLEDWL